MFQARQSSFSACLYIYIRIYADFVNEGDIIVNTETGKTNKVHRLFLIQDDLNIPNLLNIKHARAGQLVAMIDFHCESPFCQSGDTLSDGTIRYVMPPMNLPDPSKEDLKSIKSLKNHWLALGLDPEIEQALMTSKTKSFVRMIHKRFMT